MRQRTALDAAMQALAVGRTPADAAQAARASVASLPAPAAAYSGMDATRCRFCGSVPAVPLTIYEHNGYLVLMTFKNLKGPYCRNCGLHVWRRMTNATLLRGWLGMLSFFIAPVTALINMVNLPKLSRLAPPEPGTATLPPADPGQGLFHRPGVYVYMVVLGAVVVLFAIPSLVGVLSSRP